MFPNIPQNKSLYFFLLKVSMTVSYDFEQSHYIFIFTTTSGNQTRFNSLDSFNHVAKICSFFYKVARFSFSNKYSCILNVVTISSFTHFLFHPFIYERKVSYCNDPLEEEKNWNFINLMFCCIILFQSHQQDEIFV